MVFEISQRGLVTLKFVNFFHRTVMHRKQERTVQHPSSTTKYKNDRNHQVFPYRHFRNFITYKAKRYIFVINFSVKAPETFLLKITKTILGQFIYPDIGFRTIIFLAFKQFRSSISGRPTPS